MKLIRCGEAGAEKPGVIIDDKKYDVSAFGMDYNEAFFAGDGMEKLVKFISENKSELKEIDDNIRLGAPVSRPGKIICIGLNYRDHALETNAPIPAEPIVFFKAT